MPKSLSIPALRLRGWRKKLQTIPWIIAKHSFVWLLIFTCLEAICCEMLFYEYVLSPELTKSQRASVPALFHDSAYNLLLHAWQERDNRPGNTGNVSTANPFQ